MARLRSQPNCGTGANLERLGSSAESWWSRIEKLNNGRLPGPFFVVNRRRLRDVARRPGVHRHANLGGCIAQSIKEIKIALGEHYLDFYFLHSRSLHTE